MYDEATRREIVRTTASPELAPVLAPQLDVAFGLAGRTLGLEGADRAADGTLVARTVPVGIRVVAYSDDQAVVAVWTTSLLGIAGPASRIPVSESWSTETVTLRWQGGWRWAGVEHEEGPAPIGSAQVPAGAEVIAQTDADFPVVPRAG